MPSDWCRTKQYKTNRIFVTYKIHLHTKSTVPPTKLSAKASAPPSFASGVRRIRVPFPPESELSGIGRKGDSCMWYRRRFTVPKEWKGRRVMLNFGAVDRHSIVFVNGRKAGTHTGGYDAFGFDITDMLKSGENVLVVGAYDPNDGRAACGKNGPRGDYTFTSGIWQTVWLEPVDRHHISGIRLIPDVRNSRLEVTAYADGGQLQVVAVAGSGGEKVSEATGMAGKTFFLPVPDPHLWSPDDPFLYDLKLQLKDKRGKVVDEVGSYFGMRSVGLRKIDGVSPTAYSPRPQTRLCATT